MGVYIKKNTESVYDDLIVTCQCGCGCQYKLSVRAYSPNMYFYQTNSVKSFRVEQISHMEYYQK